MVLRVLRLLAAWVCVVLPTLAHAADYSFCWIGANGYSMTGRMTLDLPAGATGIATEDDVSAFKISGYRDGQFLGAWDMASRAPGDTWHLRFDLQDLRFLTGGDFPATESQGWNANGQVNDCGAPGFGFNSGSYAQDVCVNGTWITDSSISPQTPLVAVEGSGALSCHAQTLSSKSPRANHSD